MSKKDEALKLALEALEIYWAKAEHLRTKEDEGKAEAAIIAIREALASKSEALAEQPAQQTYCDDCGGFDPECPLNQPAQQQEPVAYMNPMNGAIIDAKKKTQIGVGDGYPKFSVPCYTSPQPSKPFVGLTDVEWQEIDASLNGKRDLVRIFVRAIEAKLREKNA